MLEKIVLLLTSLLEKIVLLLTSLGRKEMVTEHMEFYL